MKTIIAMQRTRERPEDGPIVCLLFFLTFRDPFATFTFVRLILSANLLFFSPQRLLLPAMQAEATLNAAKSDGKPPLVTEKKLQSTNSQTAAAAAVPTAAKPTRTPGSKAAAELPPDPSPTTKARGKKKSGKKTLGGGGSTTGKTPAAAGAAAASAGKLEAIQKEMAEMMQTLQQVRYGLLCHRSAVAGLLLHKSLYVFGSYSYPVLTSARDFATRLECNSSQIMIQRLNEPLISG